MIGDDADTMLSTAGPSWVDELPDGLMVCDGDGLITTANAQFAMMSGYSRLELIGTSVDLLVPRAHRDGHSELRHSFVAAASRRPMGPGVRLALLRRNGTELPVEISLSTMTGLREGTVVAIVRDVSERLRVETALRTTKDLLTLADERERIARDLHDTVLQRLFGLGLELQATAIRLPGDVPDRIENAVDEIDLIIREIRTAVFTLGSAGREGSLGQELTRVTTQAKRVLGYMPRLRLDGPVESQITPEIRAELLASLREALTNVARHAAATGTEIELSSGENVVMRVLDNGCGVPDELDVSSGNGLRNMAERARLLGGGCSIAPRPNRGTELRWWVPLPH